MQNLGKVVTKLNQDLRLMVEVKNHFRKRGQVTQDREAINYLILEVELYLCPVNRDHSFNLNKKEKSLALKSALSVKVQENKIVIIDSFEIKSLKTKDLFSDLKKFNYDSALFIYSQSGLDKNFKMASSNIPRVSTLNQKGINVKDLITYDKIFIETKSINELTERLS